MQGVLDAVQPKYSMLDREIEKGLLPYCQKNTISILAYSPLEQGLLTGKIGMDVEIPEGSFRNEIPWFQPENRKKVLDMLDGWEDLLEKYNCSLSQLVIAWTARPGRHKPMFYAVPGSRRTLRIMYWAGDIELEAPDLVRIRLDVEAM